MPLASWLARLVRRPRGQLKDPSADAPAFAPARLLDYELEVGCFVGPGNALGEPIPIAEVNRRVGAEAERLGITRPSYERVRELVHEARWLRADQPSAAQTVLGVATRARSHYAYVELVARGRRPRLRDRPSK